MSAKKLYRYLMIAFVAGLLLSGLLLRYASNWLTESSKELMTLRSETAALDQKRADLEIAQQTLKKEAASIETLSKVIPNDKDQARIVSELYKIASDAGVSIESVGFPASTLGNEVPKPASTPQTSNTAQTPQTAAAPAVNTAVSQATPVKDIPGLQSIDLTLGAINSTTLPTGSGVRYSELIAFMKLIERNQRTIQIKSLGIGQDGVVNREETFNLDISLTIYIRP